MGVGGFEFVCKKKFLGGMHLTIFNKLGINKYVSQIERTDLYKRPSGGEPVKLLSSSFFFAECWLNMSQRAPN